MSYFFYGCSSLEILPDISKWNTNNVINMSYMFYSCSSLIKFNSLWKIANLENIDSLFQNCSSLICLPDISKNRMQKI